jgi:hypothetical protein
MEQSMAHNVGRAADARPDSDNNLGRGAPHDREERIQQRRRNKARSIEQDPQYRNRKPHDLDREDTELHREGAAQEKPGVRLSKEEQGRRANKAPRLTRGE